ncbi:MAG: Cd2+/Zn2+-exporting ATPase [Phycisphaerales bacterium]|jgi:Cd2+/Zn2+-exporting ATPase
MSQMASTAAVTNGSNEQNDHDEGGVQCCSHHEIEIDKYIVLYLVGGMLALVSLIADWVVGSDQRAVTVIPAVVGALLLGFPLFKASATEIMRHRVSSSSLAALAILAAMAVEQYVTAAFLAFILLVADQIVRRTAFGAKNAIEGLMKLTPDNARVVENGAEIEIEAKAVRVGQIIRVRAGENLPIDGRVISGRSLINQASLTGEAEAVEVESGREVYAGTTNLTGNIDIEATRAGDDSTIEQVKTLIREAEKSKGGRQLLIEQVARFYVPVAISIAVLVYYLASMSADEAVSARAGLTAVTVLVVTCPTALLLSSPSAMVAAFASSARLGVRIKETTFLEAASNVDAIVFDKTGTLTSGRFEVSRLAPADGVEGAHLLRAAAVGEQHSNHPLAKSILRTAAQAKINYEDSGEFEEAHGRGVTARTGIGVLAVGRSSWILEEHPGVRDQIEAAEKKIDGMSGVHVMQDGKYLGAVGLEDQVRANARRTIDRLRDLGVRFVAIFTGDRLGVGERVGIQVGVDGVEAECLPEEKHELIKDMNRQGYRVLMVGDGINDGPALAEADVGVVMGRSGSDVAANSAGVALMTDELNRLPFLIQLSRRTRSIITQNIAVSILMAIIGLVLAATGSFVSIGGGSEAAAGLGVGVAALFHFAPDIFVVGNSFRLFRFGEDFLAAEARVAQAAEASHRVRREASVRGLSAHPA